MANCTKFLEAQERHAKKSHPKCRRRGTSPRVPKTVGPKTQYAILRQVVTLIPPQIVHDIDRDVRHRYKGFSRLAGVVRCAVWVRRELFAVLALMGRKRGTAGTGKTTDRSPRPLISQGFLDFPQQNLGQQAA